jgi:hypothetical protein
MAQQFNNVLTDSDIKVLLEYLSVDDERTDHRPDVRSKHPRWGIDSWPENVVKSAMDQLISKKYRVEDVTFHDSKIGLKIHTDHGSLPGTTGKTCLFTLFAEPVAHTVYFENSWPLNHDPITGVFFTRTPWTPFSYSLENKHGKMINISDLRTLLSQCLTSPHDVLDFDVTDEFIQLLESTVHKRSLPYLTKENQDKKTGYQQPAPRHNDYTTLTHYEPSSMFDETIHQEYLSHVPIQDLHGLSVENILEWSPGSVIVHDRDQLHCSSSRHTRKIFITVFYHEI